MARKEHAESSAEGRQAKANAEKADDAVGRQVQDAIAVETEQGFRGTKVDPTPNENYTAAAQGRGAPVPETRAARADGSLEPVPEQRT